MLTKVRAINIMITAIKNGFPLCESGKIYMAE